MNDLKILYYSKQEPFQQTLTNVGCHFCGRMEKCYYNKVYIRGCDAYYKICHHAYHELCQFSKHMNIIHYLLSHYLIKDVVLLILSMIDIDDIQCVNRRRTEDGYLDVNLYELSKRELKLLFKQRNLYTPYTGTSTSWYKALKKDQREKDFLWRRQYQC